MVFKALSLGGAAVALEEAFDSSAAICVASALISFLVTSWLSLTIFRSAIAAPSPVSSLRIAYNAESNASASVLLIGPGLASTSPDSIKSKFGRTDGIW